MVASFTAALIHSLLTTLYWNDSIVLQKVIIKSNTVATCGTLLLRNDASLAHQMIAIDEPPGRVVGGERVGASLAMLPI